MNYGFTTLRDLGSVDPEWPTIDLRNALNTGSPAVAVLFNSWPPVRCSGRRWPSRDRFADDSALERTGFELVVPLRDW
jgi:hypothetical protein